MPEVPQGRLIHRQIAASPVFNATYNPLRNTAPSQLKIHRSPGVLTSVNTDRHYYVSKHHLLLVPPTSDRVRIYL